MLDGSNCAKALRCVAAALAIWVVAPASPRAAAPPRAGSPANAGNLVRVVVPTETQGPLNNPYMGWGLWAGSYNDFTADRYGQKLSVADNTTAFGDDAPNFSWVLLDWPWAAAEPSEGQFDWKDFDAIINYWKARNKQIILRFWVTDDPGWSGKPGGIPCPDWLWAKGVRYREYVGNGGVKRREPDYADPSYQSVYLPQLKKLLTAFAEKYDKPSTPVILLQVMGYGHWADFGAWYSHYPWPSAQVEHETLSSLMTIYMDTFKHIQLFEMAAGEWNHDWDITLQDRLYRKALDVALAHNFGLIWTGFIDALDGTSRDLMEEYWHSHPIIAEGNWYYVDMKIQPIHGTPDENLDLALDWHANFAHFYFDPVAYKQVTQEDKPFIERGLESGGLGYRLVPTSLSWRDALPAGNLLVFRQKWVNRNAGRLYVRHFLKMYLTDAAGNEKFSEVDSSFDTTPWVKRKEYSLINVFHLKKDLGPGTYDVRIALVDGEGVPRINLGIEGRDSQQRYKVGEIRILPPLEIKGCDKDYCP
jgi:hypothetical protein